MYLGGLLNAIPERFIRFADDGIHITPDMLLTIDGAAYTLQAGDSIYYDGNCVHAFANPGDEPCVYYLAMDVAGNHKA